MSLLDLMKALLDRGADPNARLKNKLWFRPSDHDDVWVGTAGTTAFWRAAFANDVEAMRLLAARGADPNIGSSEDNSPLMAAAGVGWTANLHQTVPRARVAAVSLCLELGADLNGTDIFNYTALHGAAYRGDDELVRFLVDKGARLDVRTIFGTSVTDMANGFVAYSSLPREHPATVALLMELGAPKPSPEREGVSCVLQCGGVELSPVPGPDKCLAPLGSLVAGDADGLRRRGETRRASLETARITTRRSSDSAESGDGASRMGLCRTCHVECGR